MSGPSTPEKIAALNELCEKLYISPLGYYSILNLPKPQQCQHAWVDTGMRKTWCKKCDVTGDRCNGVVIVKGDAE